MEALKLRKDSNKKLDRNELEKLSKQELIDKIICMDAHNTQLKNIISKNMQARSKSKCLKNQKPFDFSRTNYRHVLLKFYYLGWDYQGFATQEDTNNTIEHYMFDALVKTCLIQDRESSNYHRCGRTDKGVSSFSQVISIDLRSKFAKAEQELNVFNELNYCKMLNRILPDSIQCVCWSPVNEGFSARFDCKSRTYKYFFPKANLNICAMEKALTYIIGGHDFRNFCKMDVANGVVNFSRNIKEAKIEMCPNTTQNSPYEMYQLTLKGKAFLWHQVRCIVAILFLIGQNRESPEVITELLDVDKNPRKPDYNLASEIPLNLYHCDYNGSEHWVFDPEAISDVISTLQKMWTISSVQTTMMKSMLDELETIHKVETYNSLTVCLMQGVKSKVYKPLMERQKCEALENRIEHYVKKRRLIHPDDNND